MSIEQIKKGDELTQSLDIVNDNISRLKELFPEVFTEGKIDFKVLRDILGDDIETVEEYYRFTWAGKAQARREAHKPSTGTLRPAKDESVNWNTTGNLYIEGDNLEVLKLLQKSYNNKVKMIYIDPPYNTGKDFVYKDNYKDNLKNYQQITGQVDDEGNKLSTNSDSDGRYHSNWLNMIYPRLQLARNLLTDDGVIFISIGDNEVDNMKKACHEIFGENNFIGCAGRISKKANNQGDYWAPNFDYLLTYSRKREFCVPFFGGINYSAYNITEEEGKRKDEQYQLIRLYMTSLDPMRGCNNQRYFIECPDGSFVIPPGETFPSEIKDGSNIAPKSGKDKVWRWSYKSYLEKKVSIIVNKVKSTNLVNEKGETTFWNVFTKTYLNDVIEKSSATPNNFIEDHINQSSSHELKKLGIPFDFAKPSSLMTFLSQTCRVGKEDIVLDFFSGSASTAQSVLQQNVEDLGKRKFIMVQLPELTETDSDEYKDGFKTICEIGKERIRRVSKKISEENPDKLKDLDLGFKVFKLDSSNIKGWDGNPDNLEQSLFDSQDNIKTDRTEEDVMFEILLKYGLDLTLPIEEKIIEGKKVFNVGYGALFICLADGIKSKVAEGIGAWKQEINPETCRVIFKDSGFTDVEKTNSVQTLKRFGIHEIKSI
jgi:adenine-specific DNA-methyltransferase